MKHPGKHNYLFFSHVEKMNFKPNRPLTWREEMIHDNNLQLYVAFQRYQMSTMSPLMLLAFGISPAELSLTVDSEKFVTVYPYDANWMQRKYDYEDIKRQFLSTFGTELIAAQFHPRNVDKWPGWQIDNFDTIT